MSPKRGKQVALRFLTGSGFAKEGPIPLQRRFGRHSHPLNHCFEPIEMLHDMA
jgi:hypothetical protein